MSRTDVLCLKKIVSGGQTGADRAAFDWAIHNHIPHGGWCPKGRKAEDGVIPERYALQEMDTTAYIRRTERNLIASDGTLIVSIQPVLTGGSKRTAELARKHHKPLIHIHPDTGSAGALLRSFVEENHINILNVAGPRASMDSEIGVFVMQVLDGAFLPGAEVMVPHLK